MAKKHKLPKRIAGVKIPKHLRRGALAEFAASQLGQNIIADTIVTLAAATIGYQVKEGREARAYRSKHIRKAMRHAANAFRSELDAQTA